MKAIELKGFGGVENLHITEIPIPHYSDNEVLVRIKAISINPVDIKTRKGKSLASALKDYHPLILGWDISGVVAETGKEVKSFKTGDEVFGMINFPGHGKAYAEYAAAPENHLALKPAGITHEDAAAACLAALTAWQILKDRMKIQPDNKILVQAAAGGVGHYAVQMARYIGAEVAGTASEENREFVLGLGADRHIDYEKTAFEDVLQDYDFVLDTVGGSYIDRSLKVLRKGGTIVSIVSGATEGLEEKAAAMGMTGSKFMVQSDGNDMKAIAGLLESGNIKSFISKTYPLDQVQTAHLQIETGRTRGKIVLIP